MEPQVEEKGLVAGADSSAVISDGVKRSLERGMQILSDIEQTQPDGTVFKFEVDLMYELSGDKATPRAPPGLRPANCQLAECDNSERPGGAKFLCCSKCGAKYCSRNCQVKDWKKDHKVMCNQLRDMRNGRVATEGAEQGVLDRQGTVARVLGRVRLYLCPFAVCHGETQGRGFIFMQTPNPLLELEYLRPVNSNGRRLERSVVLHFLSLGEFVDAVMQDDFELGVVRSALEAAVGSYNPKEEVVILFRARCGYMAVLVLPMVPDLSVCRQLGADYVGMSALQLNLD